MIEDKNYYMLMSTTLPLMIVDSFGFIFNLYQWPKEDGTFECNLIGLN